jgi:hypothetical protein
MTATGMLQRVSEGIEVKSVMSRGTGMFLCLCSRLRDEEAASYSLVSKEVFVDERSCAR